ncbi:hypothetical protein ABZX92_39550 [Lentzea sp. NPDC006480]|uniref:hypothetical protein n=1 Tax=Lentzea sp. NPDC006480 TaxID=3157176 RepID=UPI0033B347A8
MGDDVERREWPLYTASHENWPSHALSDGAMALRLGASWLLDAAYRMPRTALNALESLRWMERALELERTLLVAQARFEGASWTDIARHMGLTKQAVHHRYSEHATQIIRLTMSNDYSDEEWTDYIYAHFRAWGSQGWTRTNPPAVPAPLNTALRQVDV